MKTSAVCSLITLCLVGCVDKDKGEDTYKFIQEHHCIFRNEWKPEMVAHSYKGTVKIHVTKGERFYDCDGGRVTVRGI